MCVILFLPFSYWHIARFDSIEKDKQVLQVNLRNTHNISFTGMQRTKEVIHNQVHKSDVEMRDLYTHDMWHASDVEMVSDDERENPFTQSRVKMFFNGKKTVQPQKQQQDKSYTYKERTPLFTNEQEIKEGQRAHHPLPGQQQPCTSMKPNISQFMEKQGVSPNFKNGLYQTQQYRGQPEVVASRSNQYPHVPYTMPQGGVYQFQG